MLIHKKHSEKKNRARFIVKSLNFFGLENVKNFTDVTDANRLKLRDCCSGLTKMKKMIESNLNLILVMAFIELCMYTTFTYIYIFLLIYTVTNSPDS